MTTTAVTNATTKSGPVRRHWGGPLVGGFYLSMGGVHLGIVAADAQAYRLAMLFAFGIWVWCLPVLVLLVYLARRDTSAHWSRAASEQSPPPGDPR